MVGGWGCIAAEMATAADGMHPTGMHSCFIMISCKPLPNVCKLIKKNIKPISKL